MEISYTLPKGCSSNFDIALLDYFKYTKSNKLPIVNKLINEFYELEQILGQVPSIMDVFQEGSYQVNLYMKTFGSWLKFLEVAERFIEFYKDEINTKEMNNSSNKNYLVFSPGYCISHTLNDYRILLQAFL